MSPNSSSDPDVTAMASLVPVPADREMPAGRQQVIKEQLLTAFGESAIPRSRFRPHLSVRPMPRRFSRILIAGVTAAAVSAAVAITMVNVSGSRPPARPGSPVAQPVRAACAVLHGSGNGPLLDGYRTTLARAQSAVGFPLPVPHGTPAFLPTLSGVWVSPDDPLVALRYNKEKITIFLRRWLITRNPITHNPLKWFRYEQSIMGRKAAMTGKVNGQPALIVQPHTGYCPSNPALVNFYRRGLEIDILSPSYDTTALLRIARTIH